MRSALTKALAARPAATLARSSILSSVRFSSTTTEASAETTITRNAPAAPTQPTSTKGYVISRTPSDNLPVYPKTRAAGQSKFTIVKRVQGDKQAFVKDLVEGLGIPREEVVLQPLTGIVQIKVGHSRGGCVATGHASTAWTRS